MAVSGVRRGQQLQSKHALLLFRRFRLQRLGAFALVEVRTRGSRKRRLDSAVHFLSISRPTRSTATSSSVASLLPKSLRSARAQLALVVGASLLLVFALHSLRSPPSSSSSATSTHHHTPSPPPPHTRITPDDDMASYEFNPGVPSTVRYDHLVGKRAVDTQAGHVLPEGDPATADWVDVRALVASRQAPTRILHPHSMMTMDYRVERLNVHIDDHGKIASVNMG